MSGQFTVYFDGQFWVGVLEIEDAGQLRAARHVFGPEPSDVELYHFLLTEGGALVDRALQSPPVEGPLGLRATNPKRIQRQAARAAATPIASTPAQDALRRATEERNAERKKLARQRRAAEAEDAYRKRRERAKAKRRGH